MSCCSGANRTRLMNVLVDFQPSPAKKFRLKIELNMNQVRWIGRGTGTYAFEESLACGKKELVGEQTVSIKMDLQCIESNGQIIINGYMDINAGKRVNHFVLPPAIMNCIDGGPKCTIDWESVFLGEFLGTASISIKGI